ncbi:thioesterase family protein [Corynebacterium camporealensis]|uniref:acyl-CoA thioesterase n=1 Tax=Corynebacterium camporealensis TaxID=161896 RepID=UPI0034CE04F6
MAEESVVHTHRIPVRWSDFDMYRHMMNANYIELAQEARFAFAKDYFWSEDADFASVVRHLDVDFRYPLIWNGNHTVTVESQVTRVGNTSFTVYQEIKDTQGTVTCVIECVQVVVNESTQLPRPLTDKEMDILLNTAAVTVDE